MGQSTQSRLLAILANPPLTGGTRTLRRVNQVAQGLGYAEVDVANLFAIPSRTTGDIEHLGVEEAGWVAARPDISDRLTAATAVLLAYGTTAPTGAARNHFHTQVDWLHHLLAEAELPVWWIGDGPRHPSRWQRWTHRFHPDLVFPAALACSVVPATLRPSRAPARVVPRPP